ncbi:MAG: DUF1934 domain-containing protein [Clostridiales bacterium]|nr:DUF1934 domain-containing protein [Clostridiales bacterium]
MTNNDFNGLNREIIIKITDVHDGDEKNSSELITVGRFIGTDDNYSITYNEQDDEMKDCVTVLRVEGQEKVVMSRVGRYSTEIIIEKNRRHNCRYDTPYGDFMIGVYADSINSIVKNAAGSLVFSYTLDFNSSNAVKNVLNISFKEAPSKRNNRYERNEI